MTLNHLVFEFVPCTLISLLFGFVLSSAQIFSPSLLPLTLESIKLVISDLSIIETAQILHSIINHRLTKLFGDIVNRCKTVHLANLFIKRNF